MRYYQLFTNKLIYLFPFAIIFFANLLITQTQGFEYAGKLAVFIASSSFLAIIVGLRWDIALLTRPINESGSNLVSGLISILFLAGFLTLLIFLVFLLTNIFYEFLALILLASLSISISELLVNIFLKFNNTYSYIFFRSMPYMLLVIYSSAGLSIEATWILSSFTSLLFLLFVTMRYSTRLNFQFPQSISCIADEMILKLVPTFSAVITNSIMLLWLIFIQQNFGDEVTGIWINVYRIFSLPIAIMGAAFIPLLLNRLSYQKSFKDQILSMTNFTLLLVPIIFFVFLSITAYGNEIFQLLTNSSNFIEVQIMYLGLFIGFFQYSLQFWKELFQSINKDSLFIWVVIIQPFIAIWIYIFYIPASFIFLLNIILLISLASFIILLTLLVYLYFFIVE